MKIVDLWGQEQGTAWLAKNYGTVFTQGRSDKWRLAELREVEGEPVLTVTLPGESAQVKCFFFGYEVGMQSRQADANIVTFPLPLDFTYKIAGQGTHWLNFDGLRVIGLGIPEDAQNWRHLDVVFLEVGMTRYFDYQGQEQDELWMLEKFGLVTITGSSDECHVAEFREEIAQTALKAFVQTHEKQPVEGAAVEMGWPDGSDFGLTNASGIVGFPMGGGAYYYPPDQGPHHLKFRGLTVNGLGMLGETNHVHLNVVFREGADVEPLPPPPPPPPTDFDIVDKHSNIQDTAWLEHYFGTVEHHIAEETVAFRLMELREVDGGDCKVTAQDADGNPLAGMLISFRRADGTGGSSSETDSNGVALFPLNDDAMYPVPGQGPYLTIIRHQASDAVVGLGRVMGTTRHLDVTFRAGGSIPEPEPPTQDETAARWAMLFEKMDRVIELLEAM